MKNTRYTVHSYILQQIRERIIPIVHAHPFQNLPISERISVQNMSWYYISSNLGDTDSVRTPHTSKLSICLLEVAQSHN